MPTQLEQARHGVITAEMQYIAEKEFLSPEFIRSEIARGRLVIPANINHHNLQPIGIGRAVRTKINANIGISSLTGNLQDELQKLEIATRYGADTVMDLSTGDCADTVRPVIIKNSKIPIGTVPLYDVLSSVDNTLDITTEQILAAIEKQGQQGVDYMTIHVGLLLKHLPLARKRKLGIVSRGGAIMAEWMMKHQKENPLYAAFDDILDICRRYDITLSLGDGARPGCLADASDEFQFAELEILGQLVHRCRDAGVQVMVEGPGHVPLDQIQHNMELEQKLCDDAPFYILGPVVTDCAPGYDHITSSIGATLGAFYGASMLCYVTPKEHLGLPNARDVRDGVIAYKIAAHAADIALKRPHARDQDDEISQARADFDWEKQYQLALDPEKARELRSESLTERLPTASTSSCQHSDQEHFCTMCGPKFCSMRVFKELKDLIK